MDVVVAALDLPPDGSSALLAAMRHGRSGNEIPVAGFGRFGRAGPVVRRSDGGL